MNDGGAVEPPVLASPGDAPGRRIFRNTLLNGASYMLTLGLGFVLVPIAIHHLGNDSYSIWVLIGSFSVSSGYLSLADLGLQQSIVKFVAEASARGDKREIDRIASSAFAVFCGVGVLALAVVAIVAYVGLGWLNVPDNLRTPAQLLLALIGIEAFVGLPALAFEGTLEGLQRYAFIRLADLARQITYTVWALGALFTGHGVVAFGAAMTIGGLVGGVGYYIAARRAVPGLSITIGNVERDSIRKLVNFGGWVFVGKLNGVIWHQMDKVILAAVVTSTALAGYDVAYKIQATAAVVLSITASAIMPAASALSAIKDNARLEQLLLRGTRYTIALSLPIVIGAMLMAKPFIEHWVGPQFTDVAAATRLFLVYQFLASSSAIANTMLFGFGDVKICTLYASLAAAINLVVSIFLAQFWGLEGVIAGTLVGHAITTPLFIHRMMRHLDISLGTFLRGTIVPLLPWAAAFAIVLQLIKSALPPTNLFAVLIECVVALGVYATGVALVAMSDEERRTVFGFFKSARVT